MGIFTVAGSVLVGMFSGKIFLYSILSKIYQVEEPESNKSKCFYFEVDLGRSNVYFVLDNQGKVLPQFSTELNYHLRRIRGEVGQSECNIKDNELEGMRTPQELNQKESILSKGDLAEKALKAIQRRFKYNWKISDFIYNGFGALKFLFCCVNKKNNFNIKNRLELYKEGENKLTEELDAVQFIKSIRNLTTLVSSLLDDSEKTMVQYQKSHVLEIDKEIEEETPQERKPNLFSKLAEKLIHKSEIEVFMVKIIQYNEIRRII